HDYSLGSIAGTGWTGMHNIPLIVGTGQFQATGGTLRIGNNGANVGWDGMGSTAPLLYATVPGGQDFTATVKVSAQTAGQYSTAGIIARAQSATPPGVPPNHSAQSFVTMTSFRENAANVDQTETLMKRVQNGTQLNDTRITINGTAPANTAPL